jgi:hypothetical protein
MPGILFLIKSVINNKPARRGAAECHFEHYLAVFFERYVAAPADLRRRGARRPFSRPTIMLSGLAPSAQRRVTRGG